REQDHVEAFVREVAPVLFAELAAREALARALHERRRLVDAEHPPSALEMGEAAEEALVAAHVQERLARQFRKVQRLELVEGERVAHRVREGLVLGHVEISRELAL